MDTHTVGSVMPLSCCFAEKVIELNDRTSLPFQSVLFQVFLGPFPSSKNLVIEG